jgi:phospholipid/cholesterol/gamma-HCH transport system ATP-binding protein
VRNLTRSFGSRKILSDVSFQLKHGEILIIMGGSGCGKSTLLRHIIGSLKPDAGEIYIDGTEITKLDDRGMSKVRKRFGMLFQTGALFNSLTVGDNVALPILESSDVSPNIAELVVKLKLELVGLTGFEHLKPRKFRAG